MAITEDELSSLIPYTDNNQAISVGFNTADSVREIKQMLLSILNPRFAREDKLAEETNKSMKEVAHSIEQNGKTINASAEKQIDYAKKLENVSNETRKAIEEFKGYSISFLDIATKAFSNYMQETVKLSNVFRDIESNGILINQGFKSLGTTAYELGMTYEELAGHLKKSAPVIAKLNSSYKDGADIFRKSLQNISDDYNMTHDEQVTAFNTALENLIPSQLREMPEQQLIAQVDETARQMKMLSLATGKSIENIKQENDLKAQSIRVQAWKNNNPIQSQILEQLGLGSADMIDYIMSGGTRINADLFTKIAGSPYLQKALPDIMKMVQSGNLNVDSIGYLQQQYGDLALQRMNQVKANTKNQALWSVSSVSPLTENMGYYDVTERKLMATNIQRMRELQESEARKRDNEQLSSLQDYGEAGRRRETAWRDMKTGGQEGMTRALTTGAAVENGIAWVTNGVNQVLDNMGLSGMITGMGASTISMVGASSLFNWAVFRFGRAVDKLSTKAGIQDMLNGEVKPKGRFGKLVSKADDWSLGTKVGKTTSNYFGATRGAGMLRGGGLAMAGLLGSGLNDTLAQNGFYEEGGAIHKTLDVGTSALSGAGTGAMIGSMILPGVGTAIGAGVGALWSGISRYMEVRDKDTIKMKEHTYNEIKNHKTNRENDALNNQTALMIFSEMNNNLKKVAEGNEVNNKINATRFMTERTDSTKPTNVQK